MSFAQFADLSRIHFVGIGGAGMSGIAEILLEYDLEVSGSDQAAGEATERLASLGAVIRIGHAPENIERADVVVVSSAVPEANPEIREARRRGIPVVRRAEMLAELMRLKYGIAIAGTHGKTTTTSLVGHVLTEAALDPTVIVGGRVRVLGTGARLGHSQYLVAEADEYDRSFLTLAPIIAVLTNIDRDHLDTYGTMEAILDAFVSFANRVPFFGRVLVCLDDVNVQTILPRIAERRIITYGFAPQADLAAVDLESTALGVRFGVRSRERGLLGSIELPMPGRHNVQNALAAIGVGLVLRLEFAAIAAALTSFKGVHRRFETIGTWRGATVVDDYAHHPTEVAATLEAARQSFPRGKVHAVFQPHLYSRTQDQAEAFGRALLGADRALVTDIYASREQPIPGLTAEKVVEEAVKSGHRNVVYCPSWRDAAALLAAEISPGDLVLTLGAGDIYKLGLLLVDANAPEGGS